MFNRGADLAGDRRREMKRIQELLAARRLDEIAGQFDAMKRLWDPAESPGLLERRDRERTLWSDGFPALQFA